MTFKTWLAAAVIGASALAGCGGSSFQSSSTTTGTVASITVVAAPAKLPNDGSVTSVITGTLLDASGKAVAGASATFTTTAGSVTVTTGTSDSSGHVTATLSPGTANTIGSSLTVTVTSGSVSGTAQIAIASSVTSIALTSSGTSIPSDGTGSVTLSGTLLNGKSLPVSGITATFVATGGVITPSTVTSDSSGHVAAVLTVPAGTVASGTALTVKLTSGTIESAPITIIVGPGARSVALTTSSTNVPSDGSTPATITAAVVDANNNVVPGIAVHFVASSGRVTPVASTQTGVALGTTDSNGLVAVTLSAGSDQTNRAITVTATVAGDPPATIVVNVTGTTVVLSGPSSIVFGGPGTYIATVSDASGKGISGSPVNFSSKLGNSLSASTVITNSTGQATVTMTATAAGTDTLSATAFGQTKTQSVVVSGQSFAFITPAPAPATPTQININTPSVVTVTWTNTGNPVVGSAVTFATTRGSVTGAVTVSTDASGVASTTVQAAQSGLATITATGTLPGSTVTAATQIDYLATTPATITLQPSISSVPTQGSSTIVAVVRDSKFNLVEGKAVNFSLDDSTGGTLSQPSAITDNQGRAETVYTAGVTGSATNGVKISASVPGASGPVSNTTNLTVAGQAVFLSLGTGNLVSESTDHTEITSPWIVRAIDASGHAIPSQPVSVSVTSTYYYKGYYTVPSSGDESHYVPQYTAQCASEDVHNNGILDPNYDLNGNGKLDPGLVAAVVATTPGNQTDSTGAYSFGVSYPANYCNWTQVKITAAAVVNGTQNQTETVVILPCVNTDLVVGGTYPPPGGLSSRFGTDSLCTDIN